MPEKKSRSLRGKIAHSIVAVVALTLLCVGILSLFSAKRITTTLVRSNE